jgi:hypothetical protein
VFHIESLNVSMIASQTPSDKHRLLSNEPFSSGLSDVGYGQDFFSFGEADEGMDILLDMSNEIARDAGGAWLNLVDNGVEGMQRWRSRFLLERRLNERQL